MVYKTVQPNTSYLLHLKELNSLLKRFGIAPSRELIIGGANPKKNGSRVNPEIQVTVGRVVIYMKEHLSEPLSLGELAKEARLSKYQLIREFRKEKGTTPWRYLINERINKAKELLETGTPLAEVAAETGFYDQPHLNKAFQEETGQTPKEYQEQNFRNRN